MRYWDRKFAEQQKEKELQEKSKEDLAYKIFEREAKRRGSIYHEEIVKENLSKLLDQGHSPENAVSLLYIKAVNFQKRR